MRIFVTRQVPGIPGKHLDALKNAGFEVEVSALGRPMTQEELVNKLKEKPIDALLSLLTDRVDGDLMDVAGPQLKMISNYAVGFDNIAIKAATDRQIVVTNTPSDEVNEAVAEHTWALILSLTRRVVESDEVVRRGGYHGWEPDIFLGPTLKGKTLGIIGLGRIGSMVALRSQGFGMNVLYNKHEPDPKVEKETGAKFASLEELLSQSDIISLHVPLTDETRHMVNAQMFSKLKPGCYLVNTARGPIVSEKDLVEALKSGKLGGAALDVFDNEPNVDPELIGMPNVILTPHIASATLEAREKMGQQAVSAIIDTFKAVTPQNLVNPEVWEKRRK
ncbi:MAG TPA: D-glycerate dehydrogenase [Patescibacteria group bacterium]